MSLTTLEWREPLWLLLALVPVLLLLRHQFFSGRGRAYADPALLPWVRAGEERGVWRRLFSRDAAYLIAWLLLAVALSGPRHRILLDGETLPTGQAIIAVVDLSRSMDAADVLPDRRRRTALELYELLEHARGSRVGIVVFAGRAHLYVPPTDDRAVLRFYLKSLEHLVLPTRGSSAAQALALAGKSLSGEPAAAVVLLSDGDLGGSGSVLEDSVRELAAAGIGFHVLGIGTPEGEAIPLPGGGWLEEEGRPVVSRLGEARLQALAALGRGRYQRLADDDSDWEALYDHGIAASASAAQAGKPAGQHTSWREHYPWFLLPALLLLFLSAMPRGLPRSRGGPMLVVWGLLFLALEAPGEAMAADAAVHRAAHQAWEAGEYAEAATRYAAIPGYIGRMGEGASHYRAGDYTRAAGQFSRAVLAAGRDSERADALFNLGNSLFLEGDYAAAIQVFGDVLRYRREDEQAKHNLALSMALQQAVAARLNEGRAGGAGSGPRSTRAAEGLDIGERSSLSIDDSEEQAPTPLPPLPENAEALIARGLERIELAAAEATAAPSVTWQQDLAQARLRMQGLEEKPERVWKRLFEIEEGFPAPLPQPRNLPEASPW